jgi:hypothetical protein
MNKIFIYSAILFLINLLAIAQNKTVTVSGLVKGNVSKTTVSYVNIVVKSANSAFVAGTITNEDGRFELSNIP